MRGLSTVVLLEPFSEIASHSGITFLGINFANQYVNVIESEADVRRHISIDVIGLAGLPSRSLAAPDIGFAPFGPPPLHYGVAAPKAFGAGGKGIRTPDFQLAKLALYQLSYAPGLTDFRMSIFARIGHSRKRGRRFSARKH